MFNESVCCPNQAPRPTVAHPVSQSAGYDLRGRMETIGDYDKVYVTGPVNAEHAVVVIYDIFGFWETTLRGSDLMVSHLLLTAPHQVFMPDVFRGHAFPPDQDGDKEALSKFFNGTAKLENRLPEVIQFAEFLKSDGKFKTVSIMGYCWGGKLALMALSSPSSPFRAGAIVHPAMIANADGDNLARPLAFYPSKDEPNDVVEHIVTSIHQKAFKKDCDFHLYSTVHHGWAAARANLGDVENRRQYDDVYQRLADFMARVDKVQHASHA